jgi:hypothetical protein
MKFSEYKKEHIKENGEVDSSVKVGSDVKDALMKLLGADDNGVRLALMKALDNDERLVNDVINKVGLEIFAFLPQIIGK